MRSSPRDALCSKSWRGACPSTFRLLVANIFTVLIPAYSNNVDVIVWSMFAKGYNQCSDDPMGTYITPVPTFVEAYLEQVEEQEQDKGNDDYVTPDSAQYTQCTQMVIQNQEYYVMLGCTDGTSQSISVNIYTDNTCETRSTVDGYDDANIDVSDIQVSDMDTRGKPWVLSHVGDAHMYFLLSHRFLSNVASSVSTG
jgi:hypothetical protein